MDRGHIGSIVEGRREGRWMRVEGVNCPMSADVMRVWTEGC